MSALDIARVRPVIESEIDHLIAILDMLEPDPDFEDGADAEADMADDEPWLGSLNCINQNHWAKGGTDDGEEEFDGRELDTDFEPDNENEPDNRDMLPFVIGAYNPLTKGLAVQS